MNMTTKSPASGKVDTSNMKHTPHFNRITFRDNGCIIKRNVTW